MNSFLIFLPSPISDNNIFPPFAFISVPISAQLLTVLLRVQKRSNMAPSLSEELHTPEPISISALKNKRAKISQLKCAGYDLSLIKKIQSRINSGDKFYSLEFFPPRYSFDNSALHAVERKCPFSSGPSLELLT